MIDEALAAFLKVLDPADNSTGGGTASAVAGAMAAALVSMVARLSLGKPADPRLLDFGAALKSRIRVRNNIGDAAWIFMAKAFPSPYFPASIPFS